MSRIENLTAELCDELMIAAKCGNFLQIKTIFAMLIEFSAIELRKNNELGAASLLDRVGKDIETLFAKTEFRKKV